MPLSAAPFTLSHARRWRLLLSLPLLAWLTLLAGWPNAARAQEVNLQDPPSRVAWLGLTQGTVSFSPASADGASDGNDWRPAELNRPLTEGDRLWTGPRARAELHAGSTAVRMNEETSLDLVALDDSATQLRLAQGTLQLRVRSLLDGQRLEIDTPNLAFVVTQPGNYRLDVSPASDTTRVVAQAGGGIIYGSNGMALTIGSPQQGSFTGTDLSPAAPGAAVQDPFDLWAADRDAGEDQSLSARYVPRETIGYQQLDRYGDWQQDAVYGAIWLPRALPLDWAPYRAGHWSWIAPWGWTWVDDAPWGFAPFHYGRWAQIGPRWAWVPGRLPARPVYAPALVAFVGGHGGPNDDRWTGSGGAPRPALGWFPLAPGEAFRPAYRASPRYVSQLNHGLALNPSDSRRPDYRFQHQPAAVSALSHDDFVRGRPVREHLRALNATELNQAQLLSDRNALPQRPDRADRRELPRLAPAALPPAALMGQAVVRSRDERNRDDRRPDRRPAAPAAAPAPATLAAPLFAPVGRPHESPSEPRTDRPGTPLRQPQIQPPALVAPRPAAPAIAQPRQPEPAMRPQPLSAPERSTPDAAQAQAPGQRQPFPREPIRLPQNQTLPLQQDPQRRPPDERAGQRTEREPAPTAIHAAPPDARATEQVQREQQQQRQQDQQRRQNEALQGQRAQQEQARQQAQAQQLQQAQQRQQQHATPQEAQRQAREPQPQRQSPLQQERRQTHPAEAGDAGRPRPEDDLRHRREP